MLHRVLLGECLVVHNGQAAVHGLQRLLLTFVTCYDDNRTVVEAIQGASHHVERLGGYERGLVNYHQVKAVYHVVDVHALVGVHQDVEHGVDGVTEEALPYNCLASLHQKGDRSCQQNHGRLLQGMVDGSDHHLGFASAWFSKEYAVLMPVAGTGQAIVGSIVHKSLVVGQAVHDVSEGAGLTRRHQIQLLDGSGLQVSDATVDHSLPPDTQYRAEP